MSDIKQLEGWEWNDSLAQYERGDFRVVKYETESVREYYRLQIRSKEHPELDGAMPIELKLVDVVCRSLVNTCKERIGIELKY